MNDWKISLDRYLTSGPPEDALDSWCEACIEAFEDEFYSRNEEWIQEYPNQCSAWMDKLFNKGRNPKEAALIIQRAHRLYQMPTNEFWINND